MANKKTIDQLDREIAAHMRIVLRHAKLADEKRKLITRIRHGKVKQPAPPGRKVMLSKLKPTDLDPFNDPIPSFGSDPAIE